MGYMRPAHNRRTDRFESGRAHQISRALPLARSHCGLLFERRTAMDYEALLKKYMEHVASCESIDYVDHIGSYCTEVEFTAEEKAELERISGERHV
jgi:hypothetical protein